MGGEFTRPSPDLALGSQDVERDVRRENVSEVEEGSRVVGSSLRRPFLWEGYRSMGFLPGKWSKRYVLWNDASGFPPLR